MVERESLEFDVLFVGAGPASLAGAIHLTKLVEKHNQQVASGAAGQPLQPSIAIIARSRHTGPRRASASRACRFSYGSQV